MCQGGDEDGVNELSFGFGGNVGMCQEQCKLVADVVYFLDSVFLLNRPSSVNMLPRFLNSVTCWS